MNTVQSREAFKQVKNAMGDLEVLFKRAQNGTLMSEVALKAAANDVERWLVHFKNQIEKT